MDGVQRVETISVICVTEKIGDGSKENPSRIRTTYWTQEGDLIATFDPIYEVQYKRIE